MLRNQKGITLVALVVTIVVLIILAVITINITINSGLFDTAKDASAHQSNALKYDEEFSANTAVYVEELVNSVLTPGA